ncbi:trifunctional serine/threonine-protein kinase/ATP-binding protein/sensor histidine kinase [Archangium lansingense]|uniref:histidine kinase n=1 Tax=Archangium lansingense TaxID=2995310 RepID=A0ABT4APP3_9BACT|nr:trifunctional serine/threonine-protein kinase/ATP-binding protein/sensor histidine kinase [Archangium lansinium]MCY1083653.1 AAA family ATPase [Archangium lansinium]
MMDIPGHTLRGALRATGANLLFHAVCGSDNRPVIVKTPAQPSPGPREWERYRREHGILQRLREVGGVPRVHSCELVQDRPLLLLEEVDGEPLSQRVGQRLEVTGFLGLAISLASTLGEIHRRGVIHKDLKPSNLILTPEGEGRIIDFGTATLQRVEHVESAVPHLIEGTLAYMSPEQTGRMNRAVDYRTDFYSLGMTFYELLTGTLPFQARDALGWFHAHLASHPQPPHELVESVPPSLSAIVMKLLAKVADERYQGADGLKADLERCRERLLRGEREPFPLGEHDFPHHFQMPQRLYGREACVATLLESFERTARGGRPELVLVSGYSGIGKSAVIHELHRPVVERHGFFLQGKFDQFKQDIPYATLAQAILGLVQQLLAGTDEELAAWRERLREALGEHGQLLVDLVPQLELVVGRQPAVPELPPAEAQHRFNRVIEKFLGVFSPHEHPLVVFLDDLQWADLASLRLIQHLIGGPVVPPVLWVGAYRDNEVSPSHPLMLTLEELRKTDACITSLQLEPLSLAQLQQLIADALPGAGEDVVAPLSALVLEKTGGNPFFLIQLMVTLHQDGLLARLPEGRWRWDAEGVRAKGYSDNVVDFMVGRLRQLPDPTWSLLRLAACVGNDFALRKLVIVSGLEPLEVERTLEPALEEGMLARSSPEGFRFLHDRIQQAAQELIPEQERKAVHLRIGRLLLASLTPEELREKLFDVVGQFNVGAELLDTPEERLRVARLNAEAGWKARGSAAHRSAIAYFKMAFELLPGDPWTADPALAFKLCLDWAASELMNGNAAGARRLVDALLTRRRSPADTSAVYRLKAQLCMGAGQIDEAVSCLLEGLESLGMHLPPHPSWEEVVAAQEEVEALMGERSIESLLELPLVSDPDMQAVIGVLAALFTPACCTDNNLLILQLCRVVSLSLRHGNSEAAVVGYSWYGLVLGHVFKKYREGHAFGELACAIAERHGFSSARGMALYSLQIINPWTRPMARSLELIRSAFHHALQAGDFQVACYCCNHIVTDSLMLGHPLNDVHAESVARFDFVRRAGYQDVLDVIRSSQRYVQQLRGLTRSFDTLSGEDFEEEVFEAGLTSERMSTMRCWYWILKMQGRFMCGAYEEARIAGDKAAELLWASVGHIQLLDFHLYRGLTLAACLPEAAPEVRERWLEELRQHHQQLAEWASHCAGNFLAPERILFAELARVTGRREEAMGAYEEAIHSAREHGFIQNAALACELASNYWRERRFQTIAETYARSAREAYRRWGALGKVKHLEARWPELVLVSSGGRHTFDTDSTQIDALTVVKAQRAISGEIVQERLVTTLMQVAIENAGAQRGALLLARGDTLRVMAISGASPEDPIVLPPEDAQAELPWTLIAYVKRTREHVLLGDATRAHPFPADAYLRRGRARSVLCLPLLRQEALYGVLYLENNLAADAFPPDRRALLEHIASQAVISMENARLYADVQHAEAALRRANDELEARVEERTRELREAQMRLVDTARAVGMSEVASNVLHNVGNVLTSAVVNLEVMRETVAASRLGRLKQVSALFEDNRGRLGEFFTDDPRGLQMPDYFSALTEQLLQEQAKVRDGLLEMGWHVEHIRTIVQVQQNYAKTALLIDECELSELVEDALRIQMSALKRHGVTVTRELKVSRKVRVDRHKVLQILINLISNAKYSLDEMPPGERQMLVRLQLEEGKARIQVVDNGVGISKEIRERLFAHGFTTRRDGHGFGLHSSALAAKLLGGNLLLDSEGPGKGATATLELPLP